MAHIRLFTLKRFLFLITISMLFALALSIHFYDKIKNQWFLQYNINNPIHQNELKLCPEMPPNRIGKIPINYDGESLDIVEARLSLSLQPGGQFAPKECKARDRVAILVPMQRREYQLPIFLKNVHQMLMKQQIEYGIYVIEQTLKQDFNRGSVLNIGFVEALRMKDWDCFIFHDIDMIPFDDRNIYKCSKESVRHMAVGVEKFGYRLYSEEYYGGVIALTTEQFKEINGFSNLFWNWGGEDNDFGKRIKRYGLNITRPSEDIAKYRSLPHLPSKLNPYWREQVEESDQYFDISGLNSLQYYINDFKIKPTHVHISIEHIQKEMPDATEPTGE